MSSQYADPAGRYHLDSVIATGGMGVVWRGTDTRLNRPVAVKVLKAEYSSDAMFRTRFETEARNAAALHHPGIAGVYDYGAGDVANELPPYLVMELVDGQPLSSLLATARGNGRPLATAVVQDLIAQAGEALAVAHRAGIVHRDVKPANLLVTADRQVKITDFGIARAADSASLTRTGSVMGTPQYLSPEQARGNPSTPASDVYSLGVVAYECLAGRRPFEADTPIATALAHLQQPVPPLPDTVPADLAAVVTRALAKEPSERYADGGAFAAAVRSPGTAGTGAAGTGTAPVPVPAPIPSDSTQVLPSMTGPLAATPPPGTPMRRLDTAGAYAGVEDDDRRNRSPWPAAIAVILLVIAAVVVLALVLGQDDEPDPTVADTSTPRSSTPPTTEASSSEPTTEATTEDTSVQVDEGDYACSADYRDAVADLQDADLQVTWEQESSPNDGTCDPDTVSRFSRNGTLNEGDSITVFYWGPVEEPTEPTTPTTEPTVDNTVPSELPSLTEGATP